MAGIYQVLPWQMDDLYPTELEDLLAGVSRHLAQPATEGVGGDG